MYDINLVKPVILKESLDDMPEHRKKTALKFLNTTKVLTFGNNGIQILPRNDLPLQSGQLYYTGSEAAIIYRQHLGLPGCAIKTIPVSDILKHTNCYEIASDILYFLRRIADRNRRMIRLMQIDAPALILHHEYIKLQHDVEHLQNNRFLDDPSRREVSFPDPDHDGRCMTEHIPRASLCDIDYSLVRETEGTDEDDLLQCED